MLISLKKVNEQFVSSAEVAPPSLIFQFYGTKNFNNQDGFGKIAKFLIDT